MSPIEQYFNRGLKLSQLRILVLLGQLGQVQLVARELNISQPAVSRQIAELESGLGTPIIRREGSGVVFTDTGEVLFKHACTLVLQLEQTWQSLNNLSSGTGGELRLATTPTVMLLLTRTLVPLIRQQAPDIAITLIEGDRERLSALLANGGAHLLFSRAEIVRADRQINRKTVARDPFVIVCGQRHPLARLQKPALSELQGCQWVMPGSESRQAQQLHDWLQDNGLQAAPARIRSNSLEASLDLLQEGDYLAMVPRSAAYRGLQARQLHLLAQPENTAEQISVYYNAGEMSSALQIALDCLADYRQSQQPVALASPGRRQSA